MPTKGKKNIVVVFPLSTLKYNMNINCEPLLPMWQHGILPCRTPGQLLSLLSYSLERHNGYQEKKLLKIISNFHGSYNVIGSL